MRYLIVNADDFGYSYGINKGIIEAYKNGVVTSTSVMVDEVGAEEAASLANLQNLSVGLHFVIKDLDVLEAELERQVIKFKGIVGKEPDHIDTHKRRPDSDERLKKTLQGYANKHQTPVRCLGYAKFIESYFGLNIDGSGRLNEANVSVEAFMQAVDEATEEFNELMCHVGYSDDHLRQKSSYNDIRERELRVLTDPKARDYIASKGLTLTDWGIVNRS